MIKDEDEPYLIFGPIQRAVLVRLGVCTVHSLESGGTFRYEN